MLTAPILLFSHVLEGCFYPKIWAESQVLLLLSSSMEGRVGAVTFLFFLLIFFLNFYKSHIYETCYFSHIRLYSSVVLSTFTLLYDSHHHPSLEFFTILNWNPVPIKHWVPISLPTAPTVLPLVSTSVLSDSLNSTILGLSCKWSQTVFQQRSV